MKKNKSAKISGVITALVTPFYKGRIDFGSVKKLLRQQLDGGVSGLVVNGTTGESPTLEWSEVEQLFKFVKKEVDGAVPLLLGTGFNSTSKTIEATRVAKKLKADAALVVCPYYNKPSQEGLRLHFSAVAKSASVPIVLYNVPGRTVISMSPQTVIQLAKIKNIIGIKEASGELSAAEFLAQNAPQKFSLVSGDDASCIDFILAGGQGVISVVSNVIPSQLGQIVEQAMAGKVSAREEYCRYDELVRLLSVEPNPTPVKMMLYLMGVIKSPELRLPLVKASPDVSQKIKQTMKTLGLI